MRKSMLDMVKFVIDVQNASNLSGVLYSFADVASQLRNDNSEIANAIRIMWADKVTSLVGCQDLGNDAVMRAYRIVYAYLDSHKNK